MKKLKVERHRKKGKIAENREVKLTIRVRLASRKQRPIEVEI